MKTVTGDNAVAQSSKVLLAFALLLWASVAAAQKIVGEVLDAGAKVLSIDEFRQQVVQRVIVGTIPSGGTIEVVYTAGGSVQGIGFPAQDVVRFVIPKTLTGQWTTDDLGRVCTSMQIAPTNSPPTPGVTLPPRCQFWFKHGDQYFLSDSDTDRSARVVLRTLKQ